VAGAKGKRFSRANSRVMRTALGRAKARVDIEIQAREILTAHPAQQITRAHESADPTHRDCLERDKFFSRGGEGLGVIDEWWLTGRRART